MALDFWYLATLLGDVRAWLLFVFLMAMILNQSKNSRHRSWAKAALVLVILSVGITGVAVEGMKNIFDVPRICDPATNPHCPENSAFPSGHTAVAFAGFGALCLTSCGSKSRAKHARFPSRWRWLFVLPVLVGVSRLVLQVHTFADVLAGAVIGVMFAILIFYAMRNKLRWFAGGKKY